MKRKEQNGGQVPELLESRPHTWDMCLVVAQDKLLWTLFGRFFG